MKAETAKEVTSSQLFMDAVIEVSQLEQFVPTVRVSDPASKLLCAETMARVKKARDNLDAMRKTAGAPYRKMNEAVNNLFRPFLDACKKMVDKLDKQYIPYVSKEIAEAEQAQKEAMQKAIEARNVEDTEAKAEMMTPSTTVNTDSGQTIVRKGLTFTIVDKLKLIKAAIDGRNKLPLDVVVANEALVRQLVNGKQFSKEKWKKWGVKVEESHTVATKRQ